MPSPDLLNLAGNFRQVILVTGHLTDTPDRALPRFPEGEVPRVRQAIGETLDEWAVGNEDLLICGGARGGDLLCAAEAHRRGATIWLLLALPDDEFEVVSVAGGDPEWVAVFRRMLQRAPSWYLSQLVDVTGAQAPVGDAVYVRANEWMLDVAGRQAGGRPLRVLAIWDGRAATGAGGSGDFVTAARATDAQIHVIDPRSGV